MGGAERAERRRRQQQNRAPRDEDYEEEGQRRRTVLGGVLLVLLIVVVGGAVWLQNRNEPEDLPDAIPVAQPAISYPTTVENGVIIAGNRNASITLDIYEDFLCPVCAEFERRYGGEIAQAIQDGTAQVRFHLVAILNKRSKPPEYSTNAAFVGMCAAQFNLFPAFHESLFETQPDEGGTPWTVQQLIALGQALGGNRDFTRCTGGFGTLQRDQIAAFTDRARREASDDGRFGTPTVLVNGDRVDVNDADWLSDAVRGGG